MSPPTVTSSPTERILRRLLCQSSRCGDDPLVQLVRLWNTRHVPSNASYQSPPQRFATTPTACSKVGTPARSTRRHFGAHSQVLSATGSVDAPRVSSVCAGLQSRVHQTVEHEEGPLALRDWHKYTWDGLHPLPCDNNNWKKCRYSFDCICAQPVPHRCTEWSARRSAGPPRELDCRSISGDGRLEPKCSLSDASAGTTGDGTRQKSCTTAAGGRRLWTPRHRLTRHRIARHQRSQPQRQLGHAAPKRSLDSRLSPRAAWLYWSSLSIGRGSMQAPRSPTPGHGRVPSQCAI